MLDFLVINSMKNTHVSQARNFVILRKVSRAYLLKRKFSYFENKYFCNILLMAGFQTLHNKKNVLVNSNIKFQYCFTDHVESISELIFVQILVFVKEILPSKSNKTLQ